MDSISQVYGVYHINMNVDIRDFHGDLISQIIKSPELAPISAICCEYLLNQHKYLGVNKHQMAPICVNSVD